MLKKTCTVLFLTWALFLSCGGGKNPTKPGEAPIITTDPRSQIVHVDSSITFTVVASADPAPTYQWFKNGSALQGKTGASCTIDTAAFADSGNYSVVVSNSAGSATSAAATLAVYSMTITVQPASDTVQVNSPFSFTVSTIGIPDPIYEWEQNWWPLWGAPDSTTYAKDSASLNDAGVYCVVVMSPVGVVYSDSVTLTVQ